MSAFGLGMNLMKSLGNWRWGGGGLLGSCNGVEMLVYCLYTEQPKHGYCMNEFFYSRYDA